MLSYTLPPRQDQRTWKSCPSPLGMGTVQSSLAATVGISNSSGYQLENQREGMRSPGKLQPTVQTATHIRLRHQCLCLSTLSQRSQNARAGRGPDPRVSDWVKILLPKEVMAYQASLSFFQLTFLCFSGIQGPQSRHQQHQKEAKGHMTRQGYNLVQVGLLH